MTTRAEVVAEARRWVGTPFRHQGRTLGVACDCAGLVLGVAHALGLSSFVFSEYGRDPVGTLKALCDEHMIQTNEQAAGHVALMRFDSEPQHLAILGDYPHGGLTLIHAASQFKRVVEHRLDPKWQGKIVAIYRLPGVEA